MAVVIASVNDRVSGQRTTNQAVCQVADNRHQELLQVCDIRLAHGCSSAMDNFVKRIKQTNN